MKVSLYSVRLCRREVTVPRYCPECGHDLCKSRRLLQLSYETQDYDAHADEWSLSEDTEGTYETGVMCPACSATIVEDDLEIVAALPKEQTDANPHT